MLKKTIAINGILYKVEIEGGYPQYDAALFTVYFYDIAENSTYPIFSKEFSMKGDKIVPNFIEMTQQACECFKQELQNKEMRQKAIKDFEEWDGGEASSEAPHSEVSA